jgi:putative ABC transport system permease protein
MGRLVEEQIGNRLKKLGVSLGFYLQPLERIHLYSRFDSDEFGTGNINYVYLFSGIAFFIMIIACVNYINLATARYAGRAMEVGLRKTLGATRGTLITHFLGETLIFTCFTVVLALVLSRAGLGLLQSITGQVIDDDIFTEPSFLMSLAAIAILVSLISGSYPALFLSSFQPGVMLKGKIKTGVKASFFRKVLVVGQFSIAIALIIGTLTMFEQMHFVRSENLGFDMDQVLIATYPQQAPVAIETFRAEMANLPGVLVAGLSSAVPAQGINSQNVFPEGRPDSGMQLMQVMDADDNYLRTLGIEIVQGRNFSREMGRDDIESALINEAAMAKLEWENPIGKTIEIATRGPDGQPLRAPKRIVGVVKDFHSFSLHQKIEPLLIMNDRANCNLVSIKISSADPVGTLSRIKQKWNEFFSGIACDYYFLDESFNLQYQTDERLNQIFSVFAGIAILISCLGLFGLASYITEKRTREVGIRKVLGASFSRIVVMLTGEFSKWVLMANVIAWPVAYFFLNRWLQTFAYRTTIGIGIFLLSGLSALLIALLTVGWQAVRAAAAHPVDSLRYE